MRSPNQELFRLLRFAIRYANTWHHFGADARPHVKRGMELGVFAVDWKKREFTLATPAVLTLTTDRTFDATLGVDDATTAP